MASSSPPSKSPAGSLAVLIVVSLVAMLAPSAQAQEADDAPAPLDVEVVVQVPAQAELDDPQAQPAPAPAVDYIEQPDGYQYAQPAPPPAQAQNQPGYTGYGPPPGSGLPLHRAPYQEGMTVPPNAQLVSRARVGLIISGAATFAVPYLLTAFIASLGSSIGDDIPVLYVPILGPWIHAGSGRPTRGGQIFLAFDGLLQAGGVAMFIAGFVAKKQYLQFYAESDDGRRRATLAPMLGTSQGLAFQLEFSRL